MTTEQQLETLRTSRNLDRMAYWELDNLCLEAGRILREITDGIEGQDEPLTEEYTDKIVTIRSRLMFERQKA